MNDWISVKDRLPDLRKDVLVLDDQKDMWVCFRECFENDINPYREWWEFKTDNDNCCDCVCPSFGNRNGERTITHWIPLPKLPKHQD